MTSKKTIACLHAHHSNIAYIDQAFASDNMELVHFVDPGLFRRYTSDPDFDSEQARMKIREQLLWISRCHIDAILITCTNYIALLQEEDEQTISVPIIKIDEPFFEHLCSQKSSYLLLFTNPVTVPGTIYRLEEFALRQGASLDFETVVIDQTFELIMNGKKEEYTQAVARYIKQLCLDNPGKHISVAQLSMVDAAEQAARELNTPISHPLTQLADYVLQKGLTLP